MKRGTMLKASRSPWVVGGPGTWSRTVQSLITPLPDHTSSCVARLPLRGAVWLRAHMPTCLRDPSTLQGRKMVLSVVRRQATGLRASFRGASSTPPSILNAGMPCRSWSLSCAPTTSHVSAMLPHASGEPSCRPDGRTPPGLTARASPRSPEQCPQSL